MKKALAILLSCAMLLTGCSLQDTVDSSSESSVTTTVLTTEPETDMSVSSNLETQTTNEQNPAETTQPVAANASLLTVDTTSEEYIESLGFQSLNDASLMQYINDAVYSDLEYAFSNDDYIVENVSSIYISKEYIEEIEYNSKENIFFGYTLSELDEQFQGSKYVFTLGDDGQTTVKEFEAYDDTYEKVLKNVAIGTGVILICVTVSVVTGGLGAPAVSVVFAASAKTATTFALSSGVISGVSAGVVEGIKTQDFDKAIKAASLSGSEGFKWGAISGAVVGAASELYTIVNPGNAPNWKQSEQFVLKEYGGTDQVAFYGGEEVVATLEHSTRPDVVRQVGETFEAIEVKNYNLESNFQSLCRTLEKQIGDRVTNLPSNYTQRIVLDTRNRGYTDEFLFEIGSELQTYLSPIYEDIPIDIITNVGSKVYTLVA